MSRIGKMPVTVPSGVSIDVDGRSVKVKGPKGELHRDFNERVSISLDEGDAVVERVDDRKGVRCREPQAPVRVPRGFEQPRLHLGARRPYEGPQRAVRHVHVAAVGRVHGVEIRDAFRAGRAIPREDVGSRESADRFFLDAERCL